MAKEVNIEKNIKLLELITIVRNALFVIPVLVLFYKDEIGLSFQEFLITEAFFAGTILLLEVPSGWLSDIWNRKHVLLLSQITWILSSVIMLFADSLLTAQLGKSWLG